MFLSTIWKAHSVFKIFFFVSFSLTHNTLKCTYYIHTHVHTHSHMHTHKIAKGCSIWSGNRAGSLSVRQENVAAVVYYSPFDNCNICSHSDFSTAFSPQHLPGSSHTCFQSSIKSSLNRPSCSSHHFFSFPGSVSPKSNRELEEWENKEMKD